MEEKKMHRNDLIKFNILFEKERRTLLYSQKIMNDNFHSQQEDLPDSIDFIASELETSMRLRLRNREQERLNKIEKALFRISKGIFGKCESCDQEIEMNRLLARPTTSHCIHCKEALEYKELQNINSNRSKLFGIKLRLA